MTVHQHYVLGVGSRQAIPVARAVLADGAKRAATVGGRVFGTWKPLLGLSLNHVVVLTEWPDAAAAALHGRSVLDGLGGVAVVQQDVWTPTLRPAANARLADKSGGYYSHRQFDIMASDYDTFLKLSGDAWGNFEGTHGSEVIGLWRSSVVPAPSLVRMRLMAWYADMATWEASRYWKGTPAAETANAKLGARYEMTLDSAVSILERVV